MRKHVLHQHQQQQAQAAQVEEEHLHLQLDESEIYAPVDAQAPLYQAVEAGFGFLQNE